jgi:hypothetical protein
MVDQTHEPAPPSPKAALSMRIACIAFALAIVAIIGLILIPDVPEPGDGSFGNIGIWAFIVVFFVVLPLLNIVGFGYGVAALRQGERRGLGVVAAGLNLLCVAAAVSLTYVAFSLVPSVR